MAGDPSHCQGMRKRVNALGSTGSCNSAGAQLSPPSAETSTFFIRPRPLQARPVTWYSPGPCFSTIPPDGEVISDFASMVNVNIRALPDGSSSVYRAVSFLAMMGFSAAFNARNHFTFNTPSQPGRTRRNG